MTQEVKSPLRVFVGMKRDKVGQGRSDVGTLMVRAVMGHDNYLPNCLDYRAYQERRKALLLEPRGRVALLTGGIVWRLALEVLRPETVLVGPLLEEYGGYVSPENSQTVLWDEVLTPSELDLICGVYHVAKGESVAIFSIHNLSIVFRLFESGNPSFMVAKG